MPGVLTLDAVSTRAICTVWLSLVDSVVVTKVASTATLPEEAGVQATCALVPSVPPTGCEPIAVPFAVNVTVPEGAPSALESTVADTVCCTPMVPLATLTATLTSALAGPAAATTPTDVREATSATTTPSGPHRDVVPCSRIALPFARGRRPSTSQ